MKEKGLYVIFSTLVPMYLSVFLGYGSAKWWKLLTPEQCNGLGKYINYIGLPMLVFKATSQANFYVMDSRFAGADSLQKVALLFGLFTWLVFCRSGRFEWVITVVVLQGMVWNLIVLLMYEFKAAQKVLSTSNGERVEATGVSNVSPLEGGAPEEVTVEASSGRYEENTVDIDDRDDDQGPPPSQMKSSTRSIVGVVFRKFITNPNTHASVLGLVWSLITFKLKFKTPIMMQGCISINSSTVLGLVMFSIGLFIGLQLKIISCGVRSLAFSLLAKFLLGPMLMAVTSIALGLRGTILHIAILQAALPLANSPFIFAQEYDVYPDLVSTSMIIGLVLATPILLIYKIILDKL
ncbi:hypothetical protein MLD38_034103 [Melastoma candidum]|uniref:Uncharacterized protein n=1 Tax=Melastoma candidum TaxID=119954 RepID=A0ACB9MD65_9MYRT|nr:hypothetical protein MLD38_034103 [Melastoma candidum]